MVGGCTVCNAFKPHTAGTENAKKRVTNGCMTAKCEGRPAEKEMSFEYVSSISKQTFPASKSAFLYKIAHYKLRKRIAATWEFSPTCFVRRGTESLERD